MSNYKVITVTKKFADDFDKMINNHLVKVAEVGKLIDIKFCPDANLYSAMIIYEENIPETTKIEETNTIISTKANWLIWSGWKGNHDQRIDDAKCSNCGYIHPTVYKSLSKLSQICLSCKSIMSVEEC